MQVTNQHARVWAPAILRTPFNGVALLEMVGPTSAVKSVWATLAEGKAVTVEGKALTGMPPYRRIVETVWDIRQAHALLWAVPGPDADWSVGVRMGLDGGALLLDVLTADPRLPLPLVPEWGQALWQAGQEGNADERLFYPLVGEGPYAGVLYRADLDAWVGCLDRLLKAGRIAVPERVEWRPV